MDTKIIVDAMGGDKNAVEINIAGSIQAIKENKNISIILVGQENLIKEKLLEYKKIPKWILEKIEIVDSPEVVLMTEQPSKALRTKRNSSISIGINLLKDNRADAFISAGNSGAVLGFALTYLPKIKGISRPAIVTTFPTLKRCCVLIDAGANVDCKPQHLLEFAKMGSIYCQHILGISQPKVGLLSIGEEEGKGNSQTIATFELLKNSKLNFVGNIEGKDIPRGEVDVVVCDGFVGNIVLKFGEGIAEMLLKLVQEALRNHPFAFLGIPFGWRAIKDLWKKVDFAEYGGAPLLGLEKICLICHGRSTGKAIKNAIKTAKYMVEKNINKILISNFPEG